MKYIDKHEAPQISCMFGCGDKSAGKSESDVQYWWTWDYEYGNREWRIGCKSSGSGINPDGTLYCYQPDSKHPARSD